MKQIFTSKILRKVLILTFLIIGLVFVESNNKITESVQAAECCESCPVPPGDSILNYCTAECGSSSGTCYTFCYNNARNCQRHCVSCGGGSGGQCVTDNDCIYRCDGGYCTLY